MTVSLDNSKAVYKGIKDAGIRFISALPETWLWSHKRWKHKRPVTA